MLTIRETDAFSRWLERLKDREAYRRIVTRIVRLAAGNAGDVRPVGQGVSELRINYGPGYRVYFVQRGAVVIVLLCGGDKRTQEKDITAAKALAAEWKE